MKNYLVLLILISNLCFSQSESRQNFVITLGVPYSQRKSDEIFKEIVSDNSIKRIKFYQEKEIVTDLLFDENGNILKAMDKFNAIISNRKFEFDNQGRLTKISFLTDNGEFKDGYRYEYIGPYKTEYKIGDSIPIMRTINLSEENITIVSNFNKNKEWKLSSVVFKNSEGKHDRELLYNEEEVFKEYISYYNLKKQERITKSINYKNGIKLSEKDYSAFKVDKNGNSIARYSAYSTDTLKLISTHKFNKQNQILENDFPSNLENFKYDKNGLIISKTIKDRNGITTLNFFYENSLPKKIVKTNGDKELIFKYEYEYY